VIALGGLALEIHPPFECIRVERRKGEHGLVIAGREIELPEEAVYRRALNPPPRVLRVGFDRAIIHLERLWIGAHLLEELTGGVEGRETGVRGPPDLGGRQNGRLMPPEGAQGFGLLKKKLRIIGGVREALLDERQCALGLAVAQRREAAQEPAGALAGPRRSAGVGRGGGAREIAPRHARADLELEFSQSGCRHRGGMIRESPRRSRGV
jgi:hypothetical protein